MSESVNEPSGNWIEAAYKLGIPGVIAIFLIWWVTTVVFAKVGSIEQTLNEHVATTNFYLRQVCLNTAKDETHERACDQRGVR